jgi:hypothetical protein
MQPLRISPDGWQHVVSTIDESAHTCADAAAWIGAASLGSAALGLLTGFGLGGGAINFELETLVARLFTEHGELNAAHSLSNLWGAELLGSQIVLSHREEWLPWAKHILDLSDELTDPGHRRFIGHFIKDIRNGRLLKYAKKWTPLGYMHQAIVPIGLVGVSALGEGVRHVNAIAGELIDDAGNLGVSAWTLALVHKYGKAAPKHIGGLSVFSVAAVGVDVYALATSERETMRHGDAEGHTHATREVIYGTEVGDTVADAAFALAPEVGPEAGAVLLAAGGVIMGADAAVRGVIAVTDWFHHRHKKPDVKRTAASDWPTQKGTALA